MELPNGQGGNGFYCVKVGHLSRYSHVLLLPIGVPPMLAPAYSTQSVAQDNEVWRVLTTTDVGNLIHSQRFPDHQVLPISGEQHVRAFCQLFRRFHHQCSVQWVFLLPRPVAGPEQCCAVGIHPTRPCCGG